jgi:hypothetical protein
MATFLTRVELHGASGADYEQLHAEMAKLQFRRTVVADDGTTYQLPTAEYISNSELPIESVRDLAYVAVKATGRTGWVISVRYDVAAWILAKT